MDISFTTKEESKRLQEVAFLKLSPEERVRAFIKLSIFMNGFKTEKPKEDKGNFVIQIPPKNENS
jgi:hypothetical protein